MSESERYELWREAEMAARLRAWELWAERQVEEIEAESPGIEHEPYRCNPSCP